MYGFYKIHIMKIYKGIFLVKKKKCSSFVNSSLQNKTDHLYTVSALKSLLILPTCRSILAPSSIFSTSSSQEIHPDSTSMCSAENKAGERIFEAFTPPASQENRQIQVSSTFQPSVSFRDLYMEEHSNFNKFR